MSKKIYLSLNDDVLERVDRIASSYGVTRSAYLSMVIGQTVYAQDEFIKNLPLSVLGSVAPEENQG